MKSEKVCKYFVSFSCQIGERLTDKYKHGRKLLVKLGLFFKVNQDFEVCSATEMSNFTAMPLDKAQTASFFSTFDLGANV